MSVPITRLFGLIVVLFAVLIAFTSRWTVFDANALRDNHLNQRQVLEAQLIHRGTITADDGTVLAHSISQPGGVFTRRYPDNDLFSHVIGYSYTNIGQAGLERSRNDELTGKRDDISSVVDQLRGKKRVGDNVITTLDPKAQKIATDLLNSAENGKGAVVAMDPQTGAVKVMASTPGFNSNDLRSDAKSRKLNTDPSSPLFNRATQASDPPGSTMKVVTAIAAIDSGKYTPDSLISGKNDKPISGVPLSNDGGESFGMITLTKALTLSVNTVFGEVGEKLGKQTMGDYMTRLGFYSKPPLDYPASQRLASGEYDAGRLLDPQSDKIDVGRMAIGQDKLSVTPLQMAMVASAVANKGKLMRPHLTDKVVDTDGRVVDDVKPQAISQVMKPQTAQEVGEMMTHVVEEGTGTAGALAGIHVAGKTGTAEKGANNSGITEPWFIAFAPVENPKIAIAVTIEKTQGGFGGPVAGPIAKQVLEALL
jgi:peptidoglycan glycosyltransferase